MDTSYVPKKIDHNNKNCPVCNTEMKPVRSGRINDDESFSVELQCMNFGRCNHRTTYEIHVPRLNVKVSGDS